MNLNLTKESEDKKIKSCGNRGVEESLLMKEETKEKVRDERKGTTMKCMGIVIRGQCRVARQKEEFM